ncbi:MAG: rod shape-determining protein MreC [Thermaerobacterales bacterium]
MHWLLNRRVLATVMAVVAIITVITLTAREREHLTIVEEWFHDAVAPLSAGVHGISSRTRDSVDAVREFRNLREENERLRQQLAELENADRRLRLMIRSFSRLQALLGLKERTAAEAAAANVVGRSPDNWFSTVLLDVGRNDGVQRDMVVVNQHGVVGRIVRAGQRTSTVMLLTDPQSGVGVAVERSRDAGVVLGSHRHTGRLLMRFFSQDVDVQIGDRIVTSGFGGLFPPGSDVGLVEVVEQDRVRLQVLVTVRPTVDFDRLDKVLVLKMGDQPPAVDEEDAPPGGDD